MQSKALPSNNWNLLTSHGLAFLYLSTRPDATVREISVALEFTERRVSDLLQDLCRAGYILKRHHGRRNHYSVNEQARFRHELIADIPVGELANALKRYRPAVSEAASIPET